MKKIIKIAILAAALMIGTGTSIYGQVFVIGDEHSMRDDEDPEAVFGGWPTNPQNSNGTDNFVPVGEGLMALTLLGGAYLMNKRNKK